VNLALAKIAYGANMPFCVADKPAFQQLLEKTLKPALCLSHCKVTSAALERCHPGSCIRQAKAEDVCLESFHLAFLHHALGGSGPTLEDVSNEEAIDLHVHTLPALSLVSVIRLAQTRNFATMCCHSDSFACLPSKPVSILQRKIERKTKYHVFLVKQTNFLNNMFFFND